MFSNDDLNLLCNSFIAVEFDKLTSSSVIDGGCVMEAKELKIISNNEKMLKYQEIVRNFRDSKILPNFGHRIFDIIKVTLESQRFHFG